MKTTDYAYSDYCPCHRCAAQRRARLARSLTLIAVCDLIALYLYLV